MFFHNHSWLLSVSSKNVMMYMIILPSENQDKNDALSRSSSSLVFCFYSVHCYIILAFSSGRGVSLINN